MLAFSIFSFEQHIISWDSVFSLLFCIGCSKYIVNRDNLSLAFLIYYQNTLDEDKVIHTAHRHELHKSG